MFILKSDEDVTIGLACVHGSSKGAIANRRMLEWLHECPDPRAIHLVLDGQVTNIEAIFGGAMHLRVVEHVTATEVTAKCEMFIPNKERF